MPIVRQDTSQELEKTECERRDVIKCSRCGHRHQNLHFKRFESPAGEWTHWSTCPYTREPILAYGSFL